MESRLLDETQKQIDLANKIRRETPVPVFSERETAILSRVFSNIDKNTYFIYGLPEELVTALLARYSRIKNTRGLRGLFLDDFVTNLPVIGKIFTDPDGYLKEYGDRTMGTIPVEDLEKLIGMGFSLKYYGSIVTVEKIKDFLKKFLDAYGHNSIARMGIVHLAVENISILAAKVFEWARPGAGYIELSTRFVDMGKRNIYPVWHFFESLQSDSMEKHITECVGSYQAMVSVCQSHFEKDFKHLEVGKVAIMGKVFDSLGNLLPCATMTSLGVSMMGEAYQSVVRHLLADGNPECYALAYEIIEEAKRTGNSSLLSNHYEPATYDCFPYEIELKFPFELARNLRQDVFVEKQFIVPNALALESIVKMSGRNISEEFLNAEELFGKLNNKRDTKHESYQKLPDWFEHSSAIFSGQMSFRSWRDLQRMGFCTHKRGYITSNYGVYLPPDMPKEFVDEYARLHLEERLLFSADLTTSMSNFYILAQYVYMMGNFVSFVVGANLREWEFVNWQRTKWGVNEEVRKVVLKAEKFLRCEYPWWKRISRADMTWEYIFARGDKAIPKEDK